MYSRVISNRNHFSLIEIDKDKSMLAADRTSMEFIHKTTNSAKKKYSKTEKENSKLPPKCSDVEERSRRNCEPLK